MSPFGPGLRFAPELTPRLARTPTKQGKHPHENLILIEQMMLESTKDMESKNDVVRFDQASSITNTRRRTTFSGSRF
ncbi:hypothetical protein MB02_04070 [Croceicoccus estronivorus]|nr:hypothetical protein MB02_04070 [Croceicoccus estronivorus]